MTWVWVKTPLYKGHVRHMQANTQKHILHAAHELSAWAVLPDSDEVSQETKEEILIGSRMKKDHK